MPIKKTSKSHTAFLKLVENDIRCNVTDIIHNSLMPDIHMHTFGITAVMLPQLRVDTTIQYDAAHESWIGKY